MKILANLIAVPVGWLVANITHADITGHWFIYGHSDPFALIVWLVVTGSMWLGSYKLAK